MGSLLETKSHRSSNHLHSHYLLDPLCNNDNAKYLQDPAKNIDFLGNFLSGSSGSGHELVGFNDDY